MSVTAPYPYANLLATMIDAIKVAPPNSETFKSAVSCANTIATDWAGKLANNAVMPDGGVAQDVLTWIASLPCTPKMAEQKKLVLLTNLFTNNNIVGMHDFIRHGKELLASISAEASLIAQARNAVEVYLLRTGEHETFPVHVQSIGLLLVKSIDAQNFSCLALLLPHISGVLECYIYTLMSKAIAKNATDFMETLFVNMAQIYADFPEKQEIILSRLKVWIKHARDGKQPCETYIDRFRESLVASTRKRKHVDEADAEPADAKDDGADDETEDASKPVSGPAVKYNTAKSFLAGTYQVSANSKNWTANKEICKAIQKWASGKRKTYQYHATIGRTLRQVFPDMKRKEVDNVVYYNLEKL